MRNVLAAWVLILTSASLYAQSQSPQPPQAPVARHAKASSSVAHHPAKVTPPDPETVLSADLKQTLLAAADPTSTDADVRSYIRTARVQVRTEKDRTVFDKLVKFVELQDDITKQDESLRQLSFSFEACSEYVVKDFRASDFDTSILTDDQLDMVKHYKESDNPSAQRLYWEQVARDQYNNYISSKRFRHATCKLEKTLNDQTHAESLKISATKNLDQEHAKLLYNEFRTDLGLSSDTE
jgi:hypothetical protein